VRPKQRKESNIARVLRQKSYRTRYNKEKQRRKERAEEKALNEAIVERRTALYQKFYAEEIAKGLPKVHADHNAWKRVRNDPELTVINFFL
jgi:hypothetical protein